MTKDMEFKKQALLAIETLRARVRELEQPQKNEPVAIVGYAARVPGAADAQAFWQVLDGGVDAISPIPPERWDADSFFDADRDAAGKIATRRAGFIKGVADFDADFFGIAPREAEYLDPQHRLMLETAWHAIEHAGIAADALAGTPAAVYMGLSTHDYLMLLSSKIGYGAIEAYFGTGTSPAAGAGRISFRLGLQGPALSVDTACSSSLVAVHQAAEALRSGKTDLALAGGVNVIYAPATMINFSRAHMLSPDGRCKTFDAGADGYVRGEGCGVLVLKRLSDALRDGDRIRAVIKGSAVNQDGASGGLTVPNGAAQQRVIREALQSAGLEPGEIDYLEAHGTGTSLGDPIEVQAAGAVFAGRAEPLLIGSVKTNIGHLEAAAGVAGIIKVVLAMEHERLPKHLHFTTPSPHIPWQRLPVEVVAQARPWPKGERVRRAGVSSFGFSGTNAHIVLEEAPEQPARVTPDAAGWQLLPISARSPESLQSLAALYREQLAGDDALADICHSAGVGRSHLEHRAGIVAESAAHAIAQLEALAEGRPSPGLYTGVSADPPKTAWLFTGQGSQYPGMGRELYKAEPVFRAVLDHCAEVLKDRLPRPLLEVMFEDGGTDIGNTAYAQPAIFALEMGLARLWQHRGLEADVVLGHSVGQYAAACVAGVFDLDDGLLLLAERGRLFGALPEGGRMAALFARPATVDSWLGDYPALSVAAYNGAHTVISGPEADVQAVLDACRASGARGELLDTSHAFHCALLDPALDEFEARAGAVAFRPVERTLICNRTGKVVPAQTTLDAGYWRRHARQPVQFEESVATLASLGCKLLLEVGPQPVLIASSLRAWPEGRPAPAAVPTLRRDANDARQVAEALAQLYVAGAQPHFAKVGEHLARRRVDLPAYPFQQKRFWFKQTRDSYKAHAGETSEVLKLLAEGQLEELAGRLGADGAAQRVLEDLYAHHQGEQLSQSSAAHLYEPVWDAHAAPAPAGAGADWLVVANSGFAGFGEAATRVAWPDTDEGWSELLAVVTRERLARIVLVADAGADLPHVQRTVIGGACRIVQALDSAQRDTRISLVTHGAHHVLESDRVAPAHTAVWGLGKVIALEHSSLWGGLVDLPLEGATDIERGTAAALIAAGGVEDQWAVRGATAHVARLKRRAPAEPQPFALHADATVLVTGGLGVLGLEVASWLAENGAGCVVLTSRRAPDEDGQLRLDQLRDRHPSCRLRVLTADVAVEADVRRVLETIRSELPPLAGVIHAAGANAVTRLVRVTDAEIAAVFAGKVWGAWHLAQALDGAPLDFFISFSSIASSWGSFGQGAYCAANAFLDGLAAWQRGRGVAATAVNFGPWGGGMADETARERLGKLGVQLMPAELALTGMKTLVAAGATQGVVARIDWASFLPVFQLQGKRGFLSTLERELPQATVPEHGAASTLVQRLVDAPAGDRERLLLEHLRGVVAQVVRLDPEQVREDAGFFDLGMDSLMALELRRHLERDTGRALPATLAMDYPRLTDTASFLMELLGLGGARAKDAAPVQRDLVAGDPIAIVGMACRVPGAKDRDAFWQVLDRGVDATREVPADRYDVDQYYDPDPEAPGKMYVRRGAFLDQVDQFDPEFFGISPREAAWIDPQQRLLLETAWEGIEDAGYGPKQLARTRSGVYVGVGANEYASLLDATADSAEAYFLTGNALSVIAGRVAFALGLEGPTMSIDTACSSSLVALHQAAEALKSGQVDLALAGGINVLISPVTTVAACRAHMLSPDGRCKTFDAGANGYVRGEGCGVLVLKRLSDALRDGDRVRAVIKGSAVNQDGASGGLTVPNGAAQQRVIRDALQSAGLEPGAIDYLEAHGTGTSLGDPIEVQAAGAVFAGRDKPLLIGSVKTNIGHLEAAAGVAGVIKVVLAMEHQRLPKHLHFNTPSPHIPWQRLPVEVVAENRPWPKGGRVRRAGVSSFGFSGTNAHIVLEEPPQSASTPAEEVGGWQMLPLSARSPQALQALASRYRERLHDETSLADICHSAGVARSHLEHRAGIVADSVAHAIGQLEALAEGRSVPFAGVAADPPKTAWLFTGQGSQYPGMGRALYETEPVFRAVLDRCTEVLKDRLPRPLLEVMFEDGGTDIGNTAYAQPAIFALEMALARLWQHRGLEPDVVLGHSVGQFAAACVAGAFDLDDGLLLLAERGRLFGALPEGGRMAALFARPAAVESWLANYPMLSVAAYNGAHTVISGPQADVQAVLDACRADGHRGELLDTSHAFHSALLDPALEEFEAYAGRVAFRPVTRTLVCNRTGKVLPAQAIMDAAYWRRHARQPVQFEESVATLASLGCRLLLEIGPQPVLTASSLRAWPEGRPSPAAVASLRRGIDDTRQAAEALAQLYVAGAQPNFARLGEHLARRRVDLPAYPFQRRRFWPAKAHRQVLDTAGGLLGARHDLPSGDTLHVTRFGVRELSWLNDHVIYGNVVVPGATYAAMALASVGVPAELQEMLFYEPIVFTGEESREVQLSIRCAADAPDGVRTFQIHSRPHGEREARWALNASGSIAVSDATPATPPVETIDAIAERLPLQRTQQLYEAFARNELQWGPSWCSALRTLHASPTEGLGEVDAGEELRPLLGSEPLHPVLLDLCTGIAGAILLAARAESGEPESLFLPLRYGKVTLGERIAGRFFCYASARTDSRPGMETQAFDLHFMAPDGRHLGGIENFIVKRAPRQALLRGLGGDAGRLLYRIDWREHPLSAAERAEAPAGSWLAVGADDAALAALRAAAPAGRRVLAVTLDDLEHVREPVAALSWHAGRCEATGTGTPDALIERTMGELEGAIAFVKRQAARMLPVTTFAIVTQRAVAAEPSEDVDPVHAALWGLGRTVAGEQPALACTLIDVDGTLEADRLMAATLCSGAPEPALALRRQRCFVPRLMPWSRSGQLAVPGHDFQLRPSARGAINNLQLAVAEPAPPAPGWVQVRTRAAGLNFRDVLNVLGLYPGDPGDVGGELAGVITALGDGVEGLCVGQEVFGFAPGGAFASRVNVPAQLLTEVPAGTTFTQAATLPAAMLTAVLAFEWARPLAGERILIHAATGGVGLAAVQLAQRAGAIVYATASAPKQDLLRAMGVEHVYDSRSLDFAERILADTGGAGVDVVINSLTGEGFIEATVRATARGGRFVEIAKRDIWSAETMAAARADLAYDILALDDVMKQDPARIKVLLDRLAGELARGEVRPLRCQTYPIAEARAAFRCMQQARHVGKIVLQLPDPLRLSAERSYLVTGGLGALGLQTAAYLAERGAGHLVLAGRRPADAAAQAAIDALVARYGCTVRAVSVDVGDAGALADLLATIRHELPPLAGVAHLAGVLQDGLLDQLDTGRLRTVLAPKAFAAWHLHRLTAADPLEFFLLYGSVSGVLGSPGQANYAAANAFLDGLAAHRRAQGLPGTSVDWGPWADVGMASSEAARANLGKQGLIALKPAAAFAALNEVMSHGTVQATVLGVDWQRMEKTLGGARPPMLEHVLPRATTVQVSGEQLLPRLRTVPAAQRGAFLVEHLQGELKHILGLAQTPAANSKFLELGMDSLLAVELRNRLTSQFGKSVSIPSTAVFDHPTVQALAQFIAAQIEDEQPARSAS